MKRAVSIGLAVLLAAVLAGCGGDGHRHEPVVVDILSSDGAFDGDITRDAGPPETFSVFLSSDAPNTILVGDDPVLPGVDSRGFMTFSLASIPAGVSIRSATVFLPILRVDPSSPPSVDLLVDMVSFPGLDALVTQGEMAAVYDAVPLLLGPSLQVFPGDAGTDKTFDATDAVVEARRLVRPTVQLRLIGSFGQVTIDDLDLAPLLRIEYF